MPTYRDFQEFADAVATLYNKKVDVYRVKGVSRLAMVDEEFDYLETTAKKFTKALPRRVHNLTENGHYPTQDEVRDLPEALFCVDEGKALLQSSSGSLQFQTWRNALSDRFVRLPQSQNQILRNGKGQHFGLILDTTSRIANFSPPTRDGLTLGLTNASMGSGTQGLFPPIFNIPTMDVRANVSGKLFPDGTDYAVSHLFRFGRPLWAVRYGSTRVNKSKTSYV